MTNPNIVRVFRDNYYELSPEQTKLMAEFCRNLGFPKGSLRGSHDWIEFEFNTYREADKFREFIRQFRKPNAPPDCMFEIQVPR